MEKLFLCSFLTYNKLDIIDQQNIELAVTVTEVGRRHVVLVSDGIDELVNEGFRGDITDLRVRIVS